MPQIFRARNVLLMKIVLCFASLPLTSIAKTEQQPSVQVETLLRSSTSWDGATYTSYPKAAPELSVLKITIPPNTELPWHTHPMPNAAYVLSGEITVEKKETNEKQLITQGQVLPEMVGTAHRGLTGDAPVVLIVFYAGSKGMPLSNSIPGGKPH